MVGHNLFGRITEVLIPLMIGPADPLLSDRVSITWVAIGPSSVRCWC
jgi:hypothetical protein